MEHTNIAYLERDDSFIIVIFGTKRKNTPNNPKKENILKEKNNKKEKDFLNFLEMFPEGWRRNKPFQESLTDFMTHRKEKRKTLTPLSRKKLANQLSKHNLKEVITAIEKSIANGWTGIFVEAENGYKKPPYKEWDGMRYYLQPDGEYRNKAGAPYIE